MDTVNSGKVGGGELVCGEVANRKWWQTVPVK